MLKWKGIILVSLLFSFLILSINAQVTTAPTPIRNPHADARCTCSKRTQEDGFNQEDRGLRTKFRGAEFRKNRGTFVIRRKLPLWIQKRFSMKACSKAEAAIFSPRAYA